MASQVKVLGKSEFRPARGTVAMVGPVPFAGGVGVWEIVLLVLLAVLLFGTRKLPEIGRSAGRGMREFKDSVTSIKKPIDEVTEAIALDDVKDIAALRSPKTALSRIMTDGDKDKAEKTATSFEAQADSEVSPLSRTSMAL